MGAISTKIEILKDLQGIVKQICNISNTEIEATDQAGLSANIKMDSWIPDGPTNNGFQMRVLIQIKDELKNWQSVIQKSDDLTTQLKLDCDWKVNDGFVILSSDYESVTRIEDDTDYILETAVLVFDARLSPDRG
jgi:hypothetical protein